MSSVAHHLKHCFSSPCKRYGETPYQQTPSPTDPSFANADTYSASNDALPAGDSAPVHVQSAEELAAEEEAVLASMDAHRRAIAEKDMQMIKSKRQAATMTGVAPPAGAPSSGVAPGTVGSNAVVHNAGTGASVGVGMDRPPKKYRKRGVRVTVIIVR